MWRTGYPHGVLVLSGFSRRLVLWIERLVLWIERLQTRRSCVHCRAASHSGQNGLLWLDPLATVH
jgi:hypothetical protein